MKTIITNLAIISIALLLNPLTINAQNVNCHIDDWTALKAIYTNNNGLNWLNTTGWDVHIEPHSSYPNYCDLGELYGITLNKYGRIRDIDLGGTSLERFGLTGTIPTQIQLLSDLETLFLRGNEFNSEIPSEIGSLSKLKTLYLSDSEFTGNIPTELRQLKNLESLNLRRNNLIGNIPPELSELESLEYLDLGGNDLSGNIPGELWKLSNLKCEADLNGLLEKGCTSPCPNCRPSQSNSTQSFNTISLANALLSQPMIQPH